MGQHTPIPWTVERIHEVYAAGTFICRPYARKDSIGAMDQSECVANARFIARAVNCHDELIAACKAAEAFIGGDGDPVEQAIVLRALDAIIAKATN